MLRRVVCHSACDLLAWQAVCADQTGAPIEGGKAGAPAPRIRERSTTDCRTSGDSEEPKKPEDKLFKGMKYRLIGPFRGGRSLTAAGIPGDPDYLLLRGDRRRRVEVDRRRDDLVASFR